MSYTTFGFSGLTVGALSGGVSQVSATVTNSGSRAGTEVVQLYVGDPASTGEPVHQLRNFQRVTLNPGASTTVRFTVSAHDLAHWDDTANAWSTTAGTYQILIGNSSRNLPLSGNLTVSTTISPALAAGGTTGSLTVANPHGMSSPLRAAVNWQFAPATPGVSYAASGLPAGLSISPSGVISGAATATGSSTVTVTATDGSGATGAATFVWTVT
jgi:beta-glucosidase